MEKKMGNASPGDIFIISGEEFHQSLRLLSILRKRAAELLLEFTGIGPDDMAELSIRALFSEASLFSSGQLVVMNEVDKFPKPARDDLKFIAGTGISHILFARTAGRKPSDSLIKTLESAGTGFTCWEPFPNRMWLWTKKLSEEEGISFTRDGAQAVEAIATGKLERLAGVISRVALFHGKGKRAGAADVYAAISGAAETSSFSFCEEALSGKKNRAMASLSLLIDSGEEPIRLLALFYNQWRQAAEAGELLAKGIPPTAAAQKLGIPAFRWRSVEKHALYLRKGSGTAVLEAFASADHELKSGGDPLVSIASVVLTLTTGL